MSRVVIDLARLRGEIIAAEEELARLQDLERVLMSYAEPTPSVPPDLSTSAIISHILREEGRAMRTCDLVQAAQAQGLGSRVKNVQNAVSTALSRHPDLFRRLGYGLWGLAEWNESVNQED